MTNRANAGPADRDDFLENAYFPDAIAEMSLAELLHCRPLRNYLFQSSTFFHGKVGFYEQILGRLYELANLPFTRDYVRIKEDLAKEPTHQRIKTTGHLNILPTVESEAALNTLLSECFRVSPAVWLITRPSSVQKHLLVGFHNWFLCSSSPNEISALQEVIRLSDDMVKVLSDASQSNSVFVTDCELAVRALGSYPVATIRLNKLD